MERRIKFSKGQQRKFLEKIIAQTSSPSLRGLLQFGININYSTLKNYYIEDRTLPEELFLQLCRIAALQPQELEFLYIDGNWGRVKGGKISKRK